jgi:hypothetical protein
MKTLRPFLKCVRVTLCVIVALQILLTQAAPGQPGTLDPTWAASSPLGAGKVMTPIGSGSNFVRAMGVQPDGKVLITGSCGNGTDYDFCAVRYDGGPFPTPACNLDIDGDGQILGTVDSLIHARIALGMTGNAVTNGIVFPAAARPNSWALIRAHLNTWCGMSLAP